MLVKLAFVMQRLKKYLSDALVTIQTINLSVPGSELKKEMNGRGRHLEQKIWFLTINQV